MTNKSSAVFREIFSIDPWLNAKKLRGISHRELFSLSDSCNQTAAFSVRNSAPDVSAVSRF